MDITFKDMHVKASEKFPEPEVNGRGLIEEISNDVKGVITALNELKSYVTDILGFSSTKKIIVSEKKDLKGPELNFKNL